MENSSALRQQREQLPFRPRQAMFLRMHFVNKLVHKRCKCAALVLAYVSAAFAGTPDQDEPSGSSPSSFVTCEAVNVAARKNAFADQDAFAKACEATDALDIANAVLPAPAGTESAGTSESEMPKKCAVNSINGACVFPELKDKSQCSSIATKEQCEPPGAKSYPTIVTTPDGTRQRCFWREDEASCAAFPFENSYRGPALGTCRARSGDELESLCTKYNNESEGCYADAKGDEDTRAGIAHLSYICKTSGDQCVPADTVDSRAAQACESRNRPMIIKNDAELTLQSFSTETHCRSPHHISPIGDYRPSGSNRLTNIELCEWTKK
jgi:hypothetical protein